MKICTAQHTHDGPWIESGMTGPNPRLIGGPLWLVKCEGVVIAFLPAWLDDEHEEARANARLVAAAPDLLDALQNLLAQVETFCEQFGEADFETGHARAAIAKATGSAA